MDLGLLFGVIATWAVILGSIFLGGSIGYFVDIPSIVLVVLGSFTLVFMVCPAGSVSRLGTLFCKALFPQKFSEDEIIQQLVDFAHQARRDGLLGLESKLKNIEDRFMHRGLQMVIDGVDPKLVEQVLSTEIENMSGRHEDNKFVFDTLGKYAPALGMIGTLIGLVVMLQNMDDPSKIGPGMAVAILTTLYGALMSNAVFIPVADRLAKRSSQEVGIKIMIMNGLLAIQAGDNPHLVEMKLRSYLPGRKQMLTANTEPAGSIDEKKKAA